jgi:hypothetical protein
MGVDREGELPSLKKMTAKVLGKEIQGGVHDPVCVSHSFSSPLSLPLYLTFSLSLSLGSIPIREDYPKGIKGFPNKLNWE